MLKDFDKAAEIKKAEEDSKAYNWSDADLNDVKNAFSKAATNVHLRPTGQQTVGAVFFVRESQAEIARRVNYEESQAKSVTATKVNNPSTYTPA